jgi:ABC-type branched-subunit amino acid transport system substrate-binding protein
MAAPTMPKSSATLEGIFISSLIILPKPTMPHSSAFLCHTETTYEYGGNIMSRTLKTTFACVVLTLGLAQAQNLTTLKLPLVLPISSSLGAFALEVKNAATLAVGNYAPRFAKMGFKLEVAVYDDKGNPDTVKDIADMLRKDQSVRAVMGQLCKIAILLL